MSQFNLEEARFQLQELTNGFLRDHHASHYPPKENVEAAVRKVYGSFLSEEPQFVWLANPWQLMYAPALFTGFTRKQIRLDDIQEKFCKPYRDLIIEEVGPTQFNVLFDSLWESPAERQLRAFSNLVETEIRILERDRVERTSDLCRRFDERLMSKIYRHGLTLESTVLSRIGNQMSWFALEHYTGRTPPWGHMSSSHHLAFEGNFRLNWGDEGIAVAPDAIPPGMEWCHFLRLRQTIALFAERYLGVSPGEEVSEELSNFEQLAKSVHTIACFPEVCFISEPPLRLNIHNARYHNAQGPAISYAEGFDIFCWNGVRVPARAVEQEPTLDVIEMEQNLEAKRVLIERYGYEQYLNDSHAEKINEDERGTLYRIDSSLGMELILLAVQNSTPEADGSFKKYFLRVPPGILTAQEAVAWTFSMDANEYRPQLES